MSTVLVINSGSSSIKYQLVNPLDGTVYASGLVEKIGESDGHIVHNHENGKTELFDPVANHEIGLREVLRLFAEVGPNLEDLEIKAVGHRVVQGGKYFNKAALLDDAVVQKITDLCPLGPLHNPAHLKGIKVARELMPDIPQIAVFDTAFFQSLPPNAATYALKKEVAEKYEIRRYGAHGTSHKYISEQVAKIINNDQLKQIVLHMGNGASVSAVVNGRAVDTSMGLTPLEGLVMGTRTGDIDPAVAFHLARVADMSAQEIDDLFNKHSGIKGLCGDNDMRSVRQRATQGDADASLALAVYIHRVRKYIGAYAAIMGGIDAITFTAGVGENDYRIRADILETLGFLGVEIDNDLNQISSSEPRIISASSSRVKVLVVPTNEELSIAQQCLELLQ